MKSGLPLPSDTSWVSADRSLPLLQASSFGNDYWQLVYATNQSTSRIFARDPVAMISMQVEIWGKSPGVPLTPEEFAAREPLWNAKVLKHQESVERAEAEKQQRKRELRKWRAQRERRDPAPPPESVAAPSVGRNQPCTCGSGRKFKKCCGR